LTVIHSVTYARENKNMITMRNDLKPDELYFNYKSGDYFYTPNPPGVIWLEADEADQMFGKNVPANFINELED
jgi:Leu/Phe-tRNA-protein transferase